ncbi:retron Ec78 anti-phage system effector ATPase PtuA [Pseudoalteromonas undina]|uniref:Retron Ec78 anti-phage system effector ATPase PtuA n=1 Tax=Pseudoalteromonas undina TaxID=43660 RepID=A0ACC6R762_9GAMM
MNNRNKKTLKDLESKANKGELFPTFQLYQNFKDGLNNIEKDKEKSELYFKECVNYINKRKPVNKLVLDELELIDFRSFKHFKGSFESDLTVIIGNNGQGKTSILNSIAKTLSWLTSNISKEDGAGQRVSDIYDINRNSAGRYADILTNFSFGNGAKRITARLSRSAAGTSNKRDSDVKQLKEFANIFRIINDNEIVNLPLLGFYSVERSHPISKSNKESSELRDDRFDAYTSSLSGAGKFEHFIEWFISLNKKAKKDSSHEIFELQQQVEALELSVKNGINSLKPILEETKKKLVVSKLKYQTAKENQTLTDSQRLRVVVSAICKIIPSINNIWVETDSGSDIVMIDNDSTIIRVEQLSDGQRVFLSLVSDIVRRLIMLNPKLDNPLEGIGILLIDEVELHLHPKWQQNIVPDLQKAFPNLQLIITTHSPLVLSTIDKRNIRLFENNDLAESIELSKPEFQTKGVINSDVLEQLMGTFASPQNIEETHFISDFEKALQNGIFKDNKVAQEYYSKITSHFGENSSEVKKCQSLIRIQLMKDQVQSKIRSKNS